MAKKTAKKVAKKVTKAATNGRVPLKRICQELKMEPRLARRKLRNAEVSFHEEGGRWDFTPKQAKSVKEILAA